MHNNRRYFITGGTNGIGRYTADFLTLEGADVWITGTEGATLQDALVAGIATDGSVCDVSDRHSVEAAMERAHHQLGGLDGVFINAGIDGQAKRADRLEPDTMTRLLQVNVLGVLNTAQSAHRWLTRPGALVVNSSVNALRAEPGFADYNASKAAAYSLTQSMALDWGSDGLCVTGVAPGYIPSRMTSEYLEEPESASHLLADIPIGRFGKPVEIARLVGFLLGNSIPYLHGTIVPIAGGRSI